MSPAITRRSSWASQAVKPWPVIAPAGQAATHVPHPLHTAAFTRDTRSASAYSMALYGQRLLHIRQPLQ